MKKYCNIISLMVGTVALFIVVLFLGTYIRTGGSEILLATSLAALPTGFTIISISYMLRNADKRIQLLWCSLVMILIRSVQLWKTGIDFRDEVGFIKSIQEYFQQGRLSGYLKYYPANIPFVAIFHGFYLIWHDVETFEILAFFVYPLCVVAYYSMVKEITKLYKNSSTPAIPAIMFFPFAPTFCIIMTYYWPQLLGLTILFFSCAMLLRLLSSRSEKARHRVIALIGLSTTLVFSHSISTALFLLTILFLYLAWDNRAKTGTLLRIGLVTSITFIVTQFDHYSSTLRLITFAILGDTTAWQSIERYSFPDIASAFRTGPIVTLAHTGFFIVVGSLILLRAYRLVTCGSLAMTQPTNHFAESLTLLYKRLKSDTVVFLYIGFCVLSFMFAFFFGGNFLDPLRMMSWASLVALPVIVPSKKVNALLLMVVLLVFFYLLIWTVWSPWGSPFGSSPNLD